MIKSPVFLKRDEEYIFYNFQSEVISSPPVRSEKVERPEENDK